VYHDTVLNTGNGNVPKGAIRNNTAVKKSTDIPVKVEEINAIYKNHKALISKIQTDTGGKLF
jgi:hypothetical protein